MSARHEEWELDRAPDVDDAESAEERRRSTVRMFPDFAGSVLWFVEGLVAYEESDLSSQLIEQMQAWEEAWLEGLGEDYSQRTEDLERRHRREGLRLARILADELGAGFVIEYHRGERDGLVMIRSRDTPSNRAAAARFTGWADADREQAEEIAQMKSAGASFGWFASIGDAEAAAARFYPRGDQGKEGGERD